jgi:hypothetical protein
MHSRFCGLFQRHKRRAARGSSEPHSKSMEWEFIAKPLMPGTSPAMTNKRIIFNYWKKPECISGQALQDEAGICG